MRKIIRGLFSSRNPKEADFAVSDIFSKELIKRVQSLMYSYALDIRDPGRRTIRFGTMNEFLDRLYYIMDTSGPVKSFSQIDSYSDLEKYLSTIKLSSFFETLELYAAVLKTACDRARVHSNLSNFILDFNEFLNLKKIPYKFIITPDGVFITKITTKYTDERLVQPFLTYSSEEEFKEANNLFSKALRSFTKGKSKDVLKHCNTTIESILLKILNKGSGDIITLYREFCKKYPVPRVYHNNTDLIHNLIKKVQNIRSAEGDVHAKNAQVDTENVDLFLDEIAELTLNETASFGIYLIKVYKKLKSEGSK